MDGEQKQEGATGKLAGKELQSVIISPAPKTHDCIGYHPHLSECELLQGKKGGVYFLDHLHHVPTPMLHLP